MQHKRLTLLGAALLASFAMLSLGTASAEDNRDGGWESWWLNDDPIEGLWDATVNITPCPSGPPMATFKAMGLFARGGTMHDMNQTLKVGPFPRSPAFGIWEREKGRHYEFAMKFFVFDMITGAPAGWSIIRHNLVLARDGQTWVSEGTAENFDAAGAPIAPGVPARPPVGCSNASAVRFR
jgi:hypothetical protein